MKNFTHIFCLCLIAAVGWSLPVQADMVYPARLELIEKQPGRFDVQFNLPVQNMARIKATPVLPSICAAVEPPEETVTASRYTAAWQVNCTADELPGQTIGVDGLLGSQTDVFLSIKTMEGRNYSAVLKPARARFAIPPPPSLMRLTAEPLVEGMRTTFVRFDILLLAWLLVLSGGRRESIKALIVGGAACAVAQALARENLMLLPAGLPGVLGFILCVYFSNRLAGGNHAGQRQGIPAWVAGGFVGALYGGALQGFQPAQEFSRLEHHIAFFANTLGILAGLLVIFFMWFEFGKVLRMIPGLRDNSAERRILGTLTGIVALGLLIYQLSAFSLLPTLVPTAPLVFFVMAAVLGIYAGQAKTANFKGGSTGWLLPAGGLIIGLFAGAMGFPLPYETVVVPLALFALGIGLVTKRELPTKAAVVVIAFAAFYPAAQAGLFIQQNLSRPIAQMAGNGILAGFLFLTFYSASSQKAHRFSRNIRIAGGIASAVALLVWGQGYANWLQTTFLSDFAMGLIRIPVLSLVLILMAALSWPRRSKVAAHLSLAAPKPMGHIVLLGLAVFLLSIGTIQAQNPLFDQDAPRPEQARRILETLLADTYSAFNLKDEEQLFSQLSENVGDELVEDLYLDSRRRLTMGVRQGSEVTVKDVVVSKVSVLGKDTGNSNDFAYHCKWVVTARVRHLQHVHHRKNMYTGILTIRVDEGQWKIEQVDLESEDRVVVPGRSV